MNAAGPFVWAILSYFVLCFLVLGALIPPRWRLWHRCVGEGEKTPLSSPPPPPRIVAALPDNNTDDAIEKLLDLIYALENGKMKVKYGVVVLKTNDTLEMIEFGYAGLSERIGLLTHASLASFERQ